MLEIFEKYIDHVTLIETPEQYIELCQHNPNYKADIINGVDYIDDMTLFSQPMFNLMALYCAKLDGLVFSFYKNEDFVIKANVYKKTKEFDDIPELLNANKRKHVKIINITDIMPKEYENNGDLIRLLPHGQDEKEEVSIECCDDKILPFVDINPTNEIIKDNSTESKMCMYTELFAKSIQMTNEQKIIFESDGVSQFIMKSSFDVFKMLMNRLKYPVYIFASMCLIGFIVASTKI